MSVEAPAPKRNDTVKDVRRWTELYATSKQTGRRYGPPPKSAPTKSPARPMSDARREEVYTRGGGFTGRQFRQFQRMGARVYREYREAARRG